MTRRQEELNTMTVSALGDLVRTKLAKEIQEIARETLVGEQLCETINALKNKSDNSIVFMKRGGLAARTVSENAAIPTAEPSYSTVKTVTMTKYGRGSVITYESIEDARADVLDGTKAEIAIALANMKDEQIFIEALGGTDQSVSLDAGTTGVVTTFALGSGTDIIYTNEAGTLVFAGGTSYTISSFDVRSGSLVFTSAITGSGDSATFTFKTLTVDSVNSATKGTVVVNDLLALRGLITVYKYHPDVLVIRETELSDLLALDQFIDTSKYGSREALLNAEIGRIFDMKVILSTQLPAGVVLAMDTSARPLKLVPKRGVKVETDDIYQYDRVDIYATERYGVGLTNSEAVAALKVGIA